MSCIFLDIVATHGNSPVTLRKGIRLEVTHRYELPSVLIISNSLLLYKNLEKSIFFAFPYQVFHQVLVVSGVPGVQEEHDLRC